MAGYTVEVCSQCGKVVAKGYPGDMKEFPCGCSGELAILIDRCARLKDALRKIANPDNWFHTVDERGGPYTAWRGYEEPDALAINALAEYEASRDHIPELEG